MTTKTDTLLHAIWTCAVSPVHPDAKHPLIALVETFLKVKAVVIEVPTGPLCGRVFQETTELMPDLPIADVLEHELDICVPAGAIIICLSADAQDTRGNLRAASRALGTFCAEVVVDTVQLAATPFADERKEMRERAQAIMSLARQLATAPGAVDVPSFKSALARGFGELLRGPANARSADATLAALYVPEADTTNTLAAARRV